jgi:hypothetical protein
MTTATRRHGFVFIFANLNLPPTCQKSFSTFHSEYYFTAISWLQSESVSVIWMNRAQNVSIVSHCATPTWICKEVMILVMVTR